MNSRTQPTPTAARLAKSAVIVFIAIAAGLVPLEAQGTGENGGIKINGLVQIWYDHSPNNNFSSFLLKRSELKVSGFIVPGKVGYAFMMDPASVPTHLTQDLVIFYQHNPSLVITVGQMKYPLTMEGMAGSAGLDFIDRSMLAAREYGDRRDIGVTLSGNAGSFDYNVGAFNGAGTNTTDNNQGKDFAGRFGVRFMDQIRVGGSFYLGPNNRVGGDIVDVARTRTGFEASFIKEHFSIKTEFMQGSDDDRDSRGYYATLTYALNATMEFAGRFDSWDPDTNMDTDAETLITLGISYRLKGNAAKIMVNYLLHDFEASTMDAANQILVQFQTEF